jgi:hypothetical protein
MLVTMLVAGVVFAVVSLVAFLRPSGHAHTPRPVASAHAGAATSAPTGSARHQLGSAPKVSGHLRSSSGTTTHSSSA